MQTGRLFDIIYLLMDKHHMTTAELARELEVSTRTIRRDIESLSASGVPVYMTRGKNGGVHLMPHYVLDKSVLSDAEQMEILSALSALRSTGVGEDEAHERLARIFQREAIDWIDIDFSFWGAPPEYKQAFDLIKDAITSRKLLRFQYYDAVGSSSTRTVEAIRLVFKESSWYLRAFCRERDDWRIFKLIRIQWPTLQVLDESFTTRELPHSLDHAPQWGTSIRMRLLFAADAESRVREEFAPSSIVVQENGSLLVTFDTYSSVRAQHYLLSYGSDLEVLEPEALRTWIQREAQAIIDTYSKNS